MKFEIQTFFMKNGKGVIPHGWKPLNAYSHEQSGTSCWVVCVHVYMNDADRLLKEDS